MSTVGVEFGFAIISGRNQEAYAVDERYQWGIFCVFRLSGNPRKAIFFAEIALFGFGRMGFSFWGNCVYPMDDGRKGSCVAKLPPRLIGITITVEGSTRNVLTLGELGGLDIMIKCEKISFIIRDTVACELANDDSVRLPF